MKYTIYWKDGRKEVVSPVVMAMAIMANADEIAIWREGEDNNYVWNQQSKTWVKKSIF